MPPEAPRELAELQRRMTRILLRPLDEENRMQTTTEDGSSMEDVAAGFIKPSEGLTSFERLEIYNRQYWFRVLDCFHEDYPGLRAVLGGKKFDALARAYLARYPSTSFTLRNLGSQLEKFLCEEPSWAAPRAELATEMARFEWAQVVAFDGPANPAPTPAELRAADPSRLRLSLQPYLSLLELRYAVDDFSLAIKKQKALRGEASNAFESAPKKGRARAFLLPRREKMTIHLAVHRYENLVYVKRLEPEAYKLLCALREGRTLGEACDEIAEQTLNRKTDWPKKVEMWFANWSALGWFCRAE